MTSTRKGSCILAKMTGQHLWLVRRLVVRSASGRGFEDEYDLCTRVRLGETVRDVDGKSFCSHEKKFVDAGSRKKNCMVSLYI